MSVKDRRLPVGNRRRMARPMRPFDGRNGFKRNRSLYNEVFGLVLLTGDDESKALRPYSCRGRELEV